jgi:hypothetical protein
VSPAAVAATVQVRLRDARLKELAAAREAARKASGDAEPGGMSFNVELSSPYFDGPRQMLVPHEDYADSAPGVTFSDPMMSPDRSSDASGGGEGAVSMASLSTPRGGELIGRLPLVLHPKAPGTYACNVTLRSARDVRVYRIVANVIDESTKKELEFVAPARQAVSQDIPIVNNTDVEWPMAVRRSLERGGDANALWDMGLGFGTRRISYSVCVRARVCCCGAGDADGQ